MKQLLSLAISDPLSGNGQADPALSSDSRLRIVVLHTTPEGTIAALRAATNLARNLCGQIDVQGTSRCRFISRFSGPYFGLLYFYSR